MVSRIHPVWTVLLDAAAWLAFFWGPFHYALRARFYFEGITVFDAIIFLACLIAPMILLVIFRDRPAIALISGTFCTGVFAYISLFIMPIVSFWNTTTLITLAPGIQTQVGHVPMCVLFGGAILGMGGFLQIKSYGQVMTVAGKASSFHVSMHEVLPFVFAPLLYWLSMLLFPQNTNVSLVIICVASASMIIVEASLFRPLVAEWTFPGVATYNTRSMPGMKIQALRATLLWIAWAVSSVVIFLGVVMFFVINRDYPLYVLVSAFFLDCVFGAGILATVSILVHRVPVIQHFLSLAACLIMLLQYEAWILTDNLPLVNPATGTVLIIFVWTFFRLFTRYSRGNATGVRGAGIVGLMVTWLVVAYAAFIPMHQSDIASLQPMIVPVLLVLGGLAVVCNLLFHFIISVPRGTVEATQPIDGGALDAAP